jgi:tripeptidyl-peptidase-2
MNAMTSAQVRTPTAIARRSWRLTAAAALVLFGFAILAVAVPAADPWPYLPNDDIGAYTFKASHPTYDGRGVVIAILDTGVDAFAPGLLETSSGQTKIIDVRDFSTEGDWRLEEAERDDAGTLERPIFKHPDGLRLEGAGEVAVPPAPDDPVAWPVYIGVIPEERFRNSRGVSDLNDDGDQTDRFGFLVYAAEREAVEAALGIGAGLQGLQALSQDAAQTVARERQSPNVWLVIVDSDGDGDLADETVLRDYHVNHDTFRLVDEDAPKSRTLMAWAVNVIAAEDRFGEPQPPTVEFHFDDGAHGSHCAGIAAGYQVSGQDGMDGVAPGAWLISLKIGDNRLSGGATRTESMKKAYEYAAEFGRKYGVPVVCNMSYGIAAVEEGEDRVGRWLDDFLAEHPDLYVCTSAGNEGPGLSTIGLPATSASVISSGAYLSVETGRALYNTPLARPTLFTFSSRGGETAKPDIVAPGSALSSVPGYIEGEARFNGTSMASPQTAGAVACLLSGALQEDLSVHWGMVKRALIAGATRIEGLSLNDQGGGLVNMAGAWDLLRVLSGSESAHRLLGYRIETECPFQADDTSEAAYWRTPGGAPLKPETVTFTVHPVFHPDLTPDEKDTFFRSFRFKSEADWLEVIPGQRYIRGDMGMTVELQYDGKKLSRPGAYAARVIATLDGGDLSGLPAREFYLWNTVVIGQPMDPQHGYLRAYEGKDLPQAWIHRYYVDVPDAASALRVRLEVSERTGASKGARVRTEICDPEGHPRGGYVGYASLDGEQTKNMTVLAPELYPGTWEINVASSRTAKDLSDYRLTVACDGYRHEPAKITELARPGNGEAATGSLTVTRAFPGLFAGEIRASVEGFCRERQIEIEETDEWSLDFTLASQTPRASFHLELDEQTANLFTDCAVNILDADGNAVEATGFDGLEVDLGVSLPAGTTTADYTLQVVGGFALPEDVKAWDFQLREEYALAQPVVGEVSRAGGGDARLYCGVPTELSLAFADGWPAPPDGMEVFGRVRFLDENLADKLPGDRGGRLVLEVPIQAP